MNSGETTAQPMFTQAEAPAWRRRSLLALVASLPLMQPTWTMLASRRADTAAMLVNGWVLGRED